MAIAQRIKNIRKQLGLTQKQLGDLCGMPDSSIRKYESGRITPKYQTLKRIANALQTPVYVLIEDKHSGVHGMCENENDLNKLLNPDDRTRLIRLLAEIFDWNFQPGIFSSAEIKRLAELLIANGVTFKEEKECPKN